MARVATLVGPIALVAATLAAPALAKLPRGFSDRVAIGGLEQPTSAAFARDGRVFVSEKRGVVKSFAGRSDSSATVVADLRTEVHSFYERGMMSIVLDPDFPKRPFVYVDYTYDGPIGGAAPLWGKPNADRDPCLPGDPDPSYEAGCFGAGRVSRLTIGPGGVATAEQVLVEDWCQEFPSHSMGDLAFDPDGALLVGGGEGAYFGGTDIGGRGDPTGLCGDPPAEGGALRAQDLRTSGDPVTLAGTIARIDPATGAPAAGNPSADPGNDGRILAYGLRNPFRFAIRPGTDELWIGDVGWSTSEEIDVTPTDRRRDFGWPCFEGEGVQDAYRDEGAAICNELYRDKSVAKPWLTYRHGEHVAKGEACPAIPPGAISGIAFDQGHGLPQPYDGALFFADYTRNCIWSIEAGRLGKPKAKTLRAFESDAGTPIDLESGPGGLYYVDLINGQVRRIAPTRGTAELTLRSKPAGLTLGIDARTEAGRASVTVSKGSRHLLVAPLRQRSGKCSFGFERWSDGGARKHRVRIGANRRVSAVYSCRKGCGKKR